jgi:hypothetical protein
VYRLTNHRVRLKGGLLSGTSRLRCHSPCGVGTVCHIGQCGVPHNPGATQPLPRLAWARPLCRDRDPDRRTDFWYCIKYLPFAGREGWYASFGAQLRPRFDYFNNFDFGVGLRVLAAWLGCQWSTCRGSRRRDKARDGFRCVRAAAVQSLPSLSFVFDPREWNESNMGRCARSRIVHARAKRHAGNPTGWIPKRSSEHALRR